MPSCCIARWRSSERTDAHILDGADTPDWMNPRIKASPICAPRPVKYGAMACMAQ